ncbi:MAG: single-stranded DNA-binding protein [Desulfitobacteriia bacterium]
MLNRVVLIGRLTKDPELRYTQNGIAVASFTLAVDRNYKNAQGEKETDFIPCVVFRQLAELCANYLAKGKLAAVDGRIQVRSYDGQDGQRRWVTEVLGENVRFLSPKDSTAGSSIPSAASDSFSSFAHEVSLDDDIPF